MWIERIWTEKGIKVSKKREGEGMEENIGIYKLSWLTCEENLPDNIYQVERVRHQHANGPAVVDASCLNIDKNFSSARKKTEKRLDVAMQKESDTSVLLLTS